MKKMTLTFVLLALTACATATPALSVNAAENNTPIAIIDQATHVQRIETYLNQIDTLQSNFTQTAADGTLISGQFFLDRPGKLRFEYDDPIGDYIVADGLFIHYWDDELKEHNNAPIGVTLADFLLSKKIKLSGDLSVTDVKELDNGKIRLSMHQTDDPNAGKLALLFNQSPMQLEKWRITDPTGAMTEVSLTGIKADQKLAATLFVFKPPSDYQQMWQDR